MIIAIWAQTKTKVIGQNNRLPWHLPAEMHHFQATTNGHSLLFGRKTFQGLPNPILANRYSYVLTHHPENYAATKHFCYVTLLKLSSTMQQFAQNPTKHLFICGGAAIYELFWNQCDELIVSVLKQSYRGDTFFPSVDWNCFQQKKAVPHDLFTINYYTRKDY